MSLTAMSADRNLLFGFLALQLDFVCRESLIAAMRLWVQNKRKPIGDILMEQGHFGSEARQRLETLTDKHIRRHGDAAHSLQAITAIFATRAELEQMGDPDLYACLAHCSKLAAETMPSGVDVTLDRTAQLNPPTAAGPVGSTDATLDRPGAPPPTVDGEATFDRPIGPGGKAPQMLFPSGRFRILRHHASGGLGMVWVAEDEEVHREVALKEMKPGHADHRSTRARFLLEGEITGRLEHPGIVPIYGMGAFPDGRPYYVMRFIQGDSLKDAIEQFHRGDGLKSQERALEFRKLLGRFVGVCNAIAYAHSRGVLHRDLKPANVMLGKFGETLVVDWGLAKVIGQTEESVAGETHPLQPISGSGFSETVAGSAVGTPQYMSPEQAAGRVEQMGPASDVYGLGATLYCLLTGQAPFNEADLDTLLGKVERGDFQPPRQHARDVPRALEAICLKAMATCPEDRFSSARALADDIEKWLADDPVTAYREPLTQRLARWSRRHQAAVAGVGGLLLTGLLAISLGYVLLAQEQEKTTRAHRDRALAQVDALLEANPSAVPMIIATLEPYRDWVNPRLRELRAQRDLPELERARVSLALLPIDPDQVGYLRDRMLEADAKEVILIRDALASYSAKLSPGLWKVASDDQEILERRFRAVVALAAFDPENPHWERAGDRIVARLLSANPLYLGLWTDALRPVRLSLLTPLAKVFRDKEAGDRRQVAAIVLADFAGDRPGVLVDLLLDADARQFGVLWPKVQGRREMATPLLNQEIEKAAAPDSTENQKNALAKRQAQAAIALLQLGQPERVWPLLQHRPDPRLRTYVIHLLSPLGVSPQAIVQRLEAEKKVSVRRALLLCLGEYDPAALPEGTKEALTPRLLLAYRDDPDAGIHSALDWLLRQRWGQDAELRKIDAERAGQPPEQRHWFVNKEGQTFTVIPGPVEFLMGSPESEPGRLTGEVLHRRRISRSFAVATRQVTVGQWERFRSNVEQKYPGALKHTYAQRYSPEPDGPIVSVTWFEAAAYCRWLSEQEGVAEEQMCYPPIPEIKDGMKLPADYLQRTGYRLPTEAEWEYTCRAGATTSRCYGADVDLLGRYGWYQKNSEDRTWPVGRLKPNDLGVFDMHGNAWDWCQGRYLAYPTGTAGEAADDTEDLSAVLDAQRRVLRGGAFSYHPSIIRCAQRDSDRTADRLHTYGLRLARTWR